MIIVQHTILSDDIAERFFTCHIQRCKGACCEEGDLGAPLEVEELPVMEEIYEAVKPYLTPQGIAAIEAQGHYVKDEEGDFSTPLVTGGMCAYANRDEKGILHCGIEQAYLAGKIAFKKPVSCHLYPIRITRYGEQEAVNYDRWHICAPACQLGEQLAMPVYQFVKEALIRKYGQAWFDELDQVIRERYAGTPYERP